MSFQNQSSAASRLNLAQQRKQAKELLKAFRADDGDAKQRVARQLPAVPSELKLAQAQLVIAREAGFESWARLKHHLTQASQSREELVETVLSMALSGNQLAVETALDLAPELPSESLHVAAALADEAAVARHLERAHPARTTAGSRGYSPLAYLCHARLGRERTEMRERRARIAAALIAAGADARECVDTNDTPGGKFSLLAAAARHTASVDLVSVLLGAGAELEPPGSTAGPPAPPLVAAAMGGELACVKRLLASRPPTWQAREALEVAMEAKADDMAQALLEYGAWPDQAGRWAGRNGGCLHAALLLGRDVAFLKLMLAGGATVGARDRDGRSPLAVAVQLNDAEAVALLREHGATEDEIDQRDRLVGACLAGDEERVKALLVGEPDLVARCRVADQQMLCWAARHGKLEALSALLRAGFDANVPDDDGQTALHLAVRRGQVEAVELLVRAGASAQIQDFDNMTALECALAESDAERRQALLTCLGRSDGDVTAGDDADAEDFPELFERSRRERGALFEAAIAAMVAGDIDTLRTLLDRHPWLTTARSLRYHRATLLHYLGSNGTELVVTPRNAGAMAELLLARGAVVDASCRMYGGGPYETTLGMVVTSGFPEQADLTDDLVGALVRGGAKLTDPDGKSRALEGAIFYAARRGVDAMVKYGARPFDLPSAAAIGDLDYVERELAKGPERARLTEALHNAAALERLPVLERLLAAGVDVNAATAEGVTALHRAAAVDRALAIQWLLERGADPRARDKHNQATPADWAAHCKSHAAARLLEASASGD